jgi:hypothetical protein
VVARDRREHGGVCEEGRVEGAGLKKAALGFWLLAPQLRFFLKSRTPRFLRVREPYCSDAF